MESQATSWELSKENIQPLKKGRKMDNLLPALQQQADGQRSKSLPDEQPYEVAISTYEGDDPLEPWCDYIDWAEQAFPRGGKDSNMLVILQRCASAFRDDEAYRNDPRLLSVFITIADNIVTPLEVYGYMHSKGIGSGLTDFYAGWALELESAGKMRQADEVYLTGLQCGAQPEDELLQRHRQFTVRMLQASLNKDSQEESLISEEHRAILGPLKPIGRRHLVGFGRTGHAKLSEQQSAPTVATAAVSHRPRRQQPITVFSEENEPVTAFLPPAKALSGVKTLVPGSSEAAKEDERKPTKWNQAGIAVKPFPATGGHKFEVHVDEDSGETESDRCSQKSLEATNALSCKKVKATDLLKAIRSGPLSKVEELKERFQCVISKVHAKTGEMQFEEMRAARWLRKNRPRVKLTEKETCLLDIKDRLSQAVKAFAKFDALDHAMASKSGTMQQPDALLCDIRNLTEAVGLACQRLMSRGGSADHQLTDSIRASLPPTEAGGSPGSRCSSAGRPNSASSSTAATPSNNTTKIIRQLWADTEVQPSAVVSPPAPLPPLIQPCDESETDDRGEPPPVAICKPKIAFSVFTDTTGDDDDGDGVDGCDVATMAPPPPPAPAFAQLVYVPPPPEKDEAYVDNDENLQNIPPDDYVQKESKRMLMGILQPSVNIEFEPMEPEVELDLDEDMLDGIKPMPDLALQPEVSFMCPTNTGFFKDLRISSTPMKNCPPSTSKFDASKSGGRLSEQQQQIVRATGEAEAPQRDNCTSQDQSALRCYTRPISFGFPAKPSNLSAISENSREYRSSSSSGGMSTTVINQWKSQLSAYSRNKTRDDGCVPLNKSDKLSSAAPLANAATPGSGGVETSVDPFDDRTIATLMANLERPLSSMPGYVRVKGPLPMLKTECNVCLKDDIYHLSHLCAEGGYARVFKAMDLNGSYLADPTDSKSDVILKVQQPACPLEFYISTELVSRMKRSDFDFSVLSSIMEITKMYVFDDASIQVTSFHPYGTLLDVCNLYTGRGQMMPECLALYFTIEMLRIVEQIHACRIIHADIKPDNFLLMAPPKAGVISDDDWRGGKRARTGSLKLIDYGVSVDMDLLPAGTTFHACTKTDQFQIPEMLDGRPWTYQIDFFGVAASAFVLLFGHYMTPTKVGDTWKINASFKRYWCEEWRQFFHLLLNVPDCDQLPDVAAIRQSLEKGFSLRRVQKEFPDKVRELEAMLACSKR